MIFVSGEIIERSTFVSHNDLLTFADIDAMNYIFGDSCRFVFVLAVPRM